MGLLVVAALILIASASSIRDTIEVSRPLQPANSAWLTLVWLLPALPALVAAVTLSVTRSSGVAVACVVVAFYCVGLSALFVWLLGHGEGRAVHLALLVVLAAAGIAAAIATPPVREAVGFNSPGVMTAALMFVLLAIGLSFGANLTESSQLGLLERPAVWQSLVGPVLVSLPGAVIRGNPTQARALLTLVVGTSIYVLVLQAARVGGDTGDLGYEGVYFLVTVFMVLAVLIGQARHLRRH